MIEKVAQRLDEMLDAMHPVVLKENDTAGGKATIRGADRVQMVPDNKARLEAIKIVAAYSEGLPVARQLSIQADFKSLSEERKEAMLQSSAVQEALREIAESQNVKELTVDN